MLSVSDHLMRNYESYYSDSITEWRRLGAMDKARNIIHLCADSAHDSILEIGCGEGAIMRELIAHKFCRSISGLEISPSAVQMARRSGLNVTLFDGETISGEYDLAILSHVVEHLEHPRKLIYEASRAAKHLFVEVPLEDNKRLSRDYVFDPVGHINTYSPRTARRLLQTCGLKVRAEIISHPSLPLYQYRLGRFKGIIASLIKSGILWSSPRTATCWLTYHYSALCARSN